MKKVLKILSAVFALIMFVNFGTTVLAAGATLSLSPSSGTFNKGCKFSLQVRVDTGGVSTDGTDAIIIYDTSRFIADKINNGSIYPDYPGNNIDTQTGKITVSGLSSVGSAYSGAGVLATIDFTVKEDAPVGATQVKFDFSPADKAKTTDSNVVERSTIADVLNQVVDGNYVIGTGTCVKQIGATGISTPSATIYITPYPTAEPVLTKSADFATTLALAVAGLTLVSFGIFGIAIKR